MFHHAQSAWQDPDRASRLQLKMLGSILDVEMVKSAVESSNLSGQGPSELYFVFYFFGSSVTIFIN